jgi:hypothetical protein
MHVECSADAAHAVGSRAGLGGTVQADTPCLDLQMRSRSCEYRRRRPRVKGPAPDTGRRATF